MLTWEQMITKTTVNRLHPEVLRRFHALIDYAASSGVPLGVGTGWRVQPNPPPAGFAQPGQLVARVLSRVAGTATALAIDTVPERLVGLDARPLRPATGCAHFRYVNNEPWHVQPAEIPTSRKFATTLPALVTWELPGTEPAPSEEDDMKWITKRKGMDVYRVGDGAMADDKNPDQAQSFIGYCVRDGVRLVDAKTGRAVTKLADVSEGPQNPTRHRPTGHRGGLMLAEIVTGERGIADVLFLVAAILAGLAAFLRWPEQRVDGMLAAGAVALIAVGLLLQ